MRGGKLDAVITGARDPIDAGAQMLPRGLEWVTSLGGTVPNRISGFFGDEAKRMDQMVQQNEADYQAARKVQGREGFDAARLGGNVISPANLAVGARVASATAGLPLTGRIAASVPVGAAYGATQPVLDPNADFGATKVTQAVTGAVLGPVAELGANALSRVIRPQTDPSVRRLLDEGVSLSPGQILGGMAKRAEDKAMSLPVIGDAIGSSRNRSLESFNRAAANRTLGPIGKELPKSVSPGREMIDHVAKTLGDEYDRLLPQLTWKPDQQFAQEFGKTWQMAGSLPAQQAKRFDDVVQNVLANKSSNFGSMNGESFKTVESELTRLASQYRSSSAADDRLLGDAINEVVRSMRSALTRANPQQAKALARINEGYANFSRLRGAAAMLGNEEGVFTPAQLQNAVKTADKSVGKGRFARGEALMQDLSEAAKTVIPSKVPDSGTAGRLFGNAAVLGGGAVMAPNALLGLLGASAAYTAPGQYVLRAALAERPAVANPLARFVSQYGPTGALPGVLPLVEVGQQ
jgi:hypothetical protein